LSRQFREESAYVKLEIDIYRYFYRVF